MPVEESDFLLVAFKSVIAGCDGRSDTVGWHGPHFDGGIVRPGGDYVRGKGVEVDVEHLAFVPLQHVRHGLHASDCIPLPDEDAASSASPGDRPEQSAALDDVGLAAGGGGAQILVALVGFGVGAEKMAEPLQHGVRCSWMRWGKRKGGSLRYAREFGGHLDTRIGAELILAMSDTRGCARQKNSWNWAGNT